MPYKDSGIGWLLLNCIIALQREKEKLKVVENQLKVKHACQCRRCKRRKSSEEGKATHSSIFAWRIPWIEEPGGL